MLNNLKILITGSDEPIVGEIRSAKALKMYGTCPYIYVECAKCKKRRWQTKSNYKKRKTDFCQKCNGTHSRGSLHWNWRGGKYINNGKYKGYIQVCVTPEHRFYCMAGKRHSVPEHRLVMAEYLGRPLTKDEIVHHKNGKKTDNRIENLELTTNGKHCKDHHRGYDDGFKKGYKDAMRLYAMGKGKNLC